MFLTLCSRGHVLTVQSLFREYVCLSVCLCTWLFRTLARAAERCMDDLCAQGLSSTIWAFAAASLRTGRFMRPCEGLLQSEHMNKSILGLTRVPRYLRCLLVFYCFSLLFLFFLVLLRPLYLTWATL